MADRNIQFCHFVLIFTALVLAGVQPQDAGQNIRISLYTHPNLKGIASILTINRCENLPDEFNDKVTSVRTNDCVMLYADYCCQGVAVQISDTEDFSNGPLDKTISSVSPCGHYQTAAPKEIIETWDWHNEIMRQVVELHDIRLYHNDLVIKSSAMWDHADFIDNVWRYTKYHYGNFGPEGGPLFVFFHAKSHRKFGSTTRNYFDRDSKCRNLIDLSSEGQLAWSGSLTREEKDEIVTAIARLVEWSSKGVYFNPAWGENVWGWGTWPWTEIYVFDIYNGLDMSSDALRVYNKFSSSSHDYPHPGTFWFRDWFFPIYEKYGGARVLNNYFETLARHFPRNTYELEWKYDRDMNLGEFVHFFSGAVGFDLRDQAEVAFNWDDHHENEFLQAQKDFPRIRYKI